MNKQDRHEFEELKNLILSINSAKYDPENGEWKTARAVFESKTVDALDSINGKLSDLKACTDKIPELINIVNDNSRWRKKMNKVMLWVGMGLGTPILSGIGYLIFKALTD